MSQPVDIHALAGAYALDAVDDIERAAFGRHLAECGTCAIEVAELRETTAFLAGPVEEQPPPRMRAEVLAAVRRTRQVGPGERDRAPQTSAQAVARWRRWTAGAVAASVLAVGAAAATYAIQQEQIDQERQTSAEARRVQQVLTAPDLVMRRTDVARGGVVTMALSPSQNAGVVLLNELPPPGADMGYQLWLITGQQAPKNVGVIPAGQGTAGHIVEGVQGADVLAVSLEPAGGPVAQPSQDIVSQLRLT